eukprot:1555168-Prymnesium_polylepis.1
MTIQNEPLHSADGAWTMYLNASYQVRRSQSIVSRGIRTYHVRSTRRTRCGGSHSVVVEAILVGRLGVALRNASISTELWAYDHNTDRPDVPQASSQSSKQSWWQ